MNSVVKGLLTAFVSLFLIAYVSYQAYLTLYHPLKTQRVYSGTVQDTISTEVFIIHDEMVVKSSANGVLDYTRSDGERVAKGGVIANVYASEQDAVNALKAQELSDKIQQLQNAGSNQSSTNVDINVLNNEINDQLIQVADKSSISSLEDLDSAKENLLGLLNEKSITTGASQNFNAQIAQLQKQKDSLKIGNTVQTISSPEAGYFVSSVDGYEGMYDSSKISGISTSDITNMENAKPNIQQGAVGKVVSQYKWYITCVLGADDARKLKVGDSVEVNFLLSSEGDVPVTVAAINRNADKYAVVFECDAMTTKLAVMRKQTVRIVASEYTGIKIQNSLIHVVDNTKGVYVLNANTVKFKKLQPIYSGNGYIVSSINTDDQTYLQVYDKVVTNGDDLYDGKVVK